MWEDLNFFVGSWQGSGKGQPGISHVERSYQFVLNNKFLEVKNKSIWAPKIDNPEGEVHEDFGVISFDTARKSFIFRQFHVEGFVNQYVLRLSLSGREYDRFYYRKHREHTNRMACKGNLPNKLS